jgi:Tfp pilus assembly PilM family ATPase
MLAIEWTNKRVRIVEGQASGESIKLSNAFLLDVPDSIEASDPERVGEFIRVELSRRKIKDRRAAFCIDRRNVILKVADAGNVSEGELATVVRLQALRDLTLPPEETIVDYMRVQGDENVQTQVVVAVVRNEIVTSCQTLAKSAGLRLEGIWPASLAHVRSAISGIPTMITHAGEEHFLVVPYGDSVELGLLRGTRFLTSASRPVSRPAAGAGETDSFLQALKRLQASLSGQYTDVKVQSVLVAGEPGDEEMRQSLTEQFGADVIFFDPIRSFPASDIHPDDRGAFAGVVGSLLVATRPVDEKINFLHPKRAKPKADWRRTGTLAGLVLLLGLGLAGYRYRTGEERVLDQAIASAKKKKVDREKEVKSLKVQREQLAFLEGWQARDVNWLNVIRTLLVTMPEADKLFLTRMQMQSGSPTAEAVASIQLEGFADDSKTILSLNSRLSEELGLLVTPGAIQPAPRFAGYNWRYSAKIGIPRDWKGMKKLGVPGRLPAPVPRGSTEESTEGVDRPSSGTSGGSRSGEEESR